MKLLCVVPSYWPAFQYGGPIYSVHGLNKALVKKGINVNVYTTNVGLNEKVPVKLEIDVDGVKVMYFAFTKFFEFVGATGWQFSWSLTQALKNNLKAFDIVYIVTVWNYPTVAAAHYCRQYKKPYIIAPRGTLYSYTLGKKVWKKIPYYALVVRENMMGASAIHYTTEDEAEGCHSFLGLRNKAIVIPNGVHLSECNDLPERESLKKRYPHLENKNVILFLSRINWKKGLDILIRAYAKLTRERNDVHLLIVGNDDENYGTKVKQWLREYNLEYNEFSYSSAILNHESCIMHPDAKVTFTGMLTGREKLEAFVGSDIFVLPSYSENFGMAVVEAMACGIPVVISNKVGVYKEIQENKAGIVVDTNAESLFKGLKLLLESDHLREEIAENGRRLVREYYNIDKVAERMIEAYEGILLEGEFR